jgi:hypothetical protein
MDSASSPDRKMPPLLGLGIIIFYLIWFLLKKNNQIEFIFLKKSKPNRPVSVRFGFLE